MKPRTWRRAPALGVIVVALLAALPLVERNNAAIDFLTNAGIFVVLALGLNIVVGFAGLLDLGFAAFFAIGSYAYAMAASPQFGLHVPFWIMLFAGAAIAGAFGIVLGAPTLRLRGDYLAIVTLGFGEIVPQTFLNLPQYTNGPNGIGSLDMPSLFGRSFGFSAIPYYYVVLALGALAAAAAANLQNSRVGRAWMAIREDELAARHVGIDATATKLSAFAMGAALGGLGGVAYAAKLGLVSPDEFGFNVSVLILAMLILGGMGNIAGVLVGSLVLSFVNGFLLPQAGRLVAQTGLPPVDLTNYRFLVYGVILVGMMLARPAGLLPSRIRRAEFAAARTDADTSAREQTLYEASSRMPAGDR